MKILLKVIELESEMNLAISFSFSAHEISVGGTVLHWWRIIKRSTLDLLYSIVLKFTYVQGRRFANKKKNKPVQHEENRSEDYILKIENRQKSICLCMCPTSIAMILSHSLDMQ